MKKIQFRIKIYEEESYIQIRKIKEHIQKEIFMR